MRRTERSALRWGESSITHLTSHTTITQETRTVRLYCAQPQLPSPKEGTYSYSFLSPDSMLAKCLYYGYGGPGFSDYTDRQLSGQWDGEDDAYCLTHIIYRSPMIRQQAQMRILSEDFRRAGRTRQRAFTAM